MSLSEDLAAIPTGTRPANECSVCFELRDADAAEHQAVNNALAGGASASLVSSALRRNGYDVSADSIRRHLKNGHTL